MAEWKIRLLALIPPILFACYLVWDLSSSEVSKPRCLEQQPLILSCNTDTA